MLDRLDTRPSDSQTEGFERAQNRAPGILAAQRRSRFLLAATLATTTMSAACKSDDVYPEDSFTSNYYTELPPSAFPDLLTPVEEDGSTKTLEDMVPVFVDLNELRFSTVGSHEGEQMGLYIRARFWSFIKPQRFYDDTFILADVKSVKAIRDKEAGAGFKVDFEGVTTTYCMMDKRTGEPWNYAEDPKEYDDRLHDVYEDTSFSIDFFPNEDESRIEVDGKVSMSPVTIRVESTLSALEEDLPTLELGTSASCIRKPTGSSEYDTDF